MVKKKLLICTTAIAIMSLNSIKAVQAIPANDNKAESSKAGNVLSDSAITAEVKGKFIADDLVKSHEINVETVNGVITLTGHVSTLEELNRANDIAKNVKGVLKVDNNLTIK